MSGPRAKSIAALRVLVQGGGLTLLWRALLTSALVCGIGLLPWLSRTDPALTVLKARSAERDPTPRALAAVRDELGLDDGPLLSPARSSSSAAPPPAPCSTSASRPPSPGSSSPPYRPSRSRSCRSARRRQNNGPAARREPADRAASVRSRRRAPRGPVHTSLADRDRRPRPPERCEDG